MCNVLAHMLFYCYTFESLCDVLSRLYSDSVYDLIRFQFLEGFLHLGEDELNWHELRLVRDIEDPLEALVLIGLAANV